MRPAPSWTVTPRPSRVPDRLKSSRHAPKAHRYDRLVANAVAELHTGLLVQRGATATWVVNVTDDLRADGFYLRDRSATPCLLGPMCFAGVRRMTNRAATSRITPTQATRPQAEIRWARRP